MTKHVLFVILVLSNFLFFSGCGGSTSEVKPEFTTQEEKLNKSKIQAKFDSIRPKILADLDKPTDSLFIKFSETDRVIFSQKDFKSENRFSSSPFDEVQRITQKSIDNYLETDFLIDLTIPKKPYLVTSYPAEIQKPELPKEKKLIRGKFETLDEFNLRQKQNTQERENIVFELQQQFRANVELRNQEVQNIKKANNEKIAIYNQKIDELKKFKISQNKTFQKIYEIKKSNVDKSFKDIFTRIAVFNVFGSFEFIAKDYNVDKLKFLAEIKSKNAKYSREFTFQIDPKTAETIYNNPKQANLKAIFKVKNNQISLEKVEVNHKLASLDQKFEKAKTIQYTIKSKKADFSDSQIVEVASLTIDGNSASLSDLQSPNLPDYKIEKINFTDYQDDIPTLLKNKTQVKSDKTKWAFIVGVEKYEDSTDVTFSKNSSQLFKEVVKKSFGIPERNIFALIQDNATSSQIKDKLKIMLKQVKNGDTIYFYYSGHGIPDVKTEKAFILPKDKLVDFVTQDENLQLDHIYKQLTDSKAGKVVAFIDACFSGKTGANKNDSIYIGKGFGAVAIKRISREFDKNKMTILTAGTDKDFSNMFKEKGHRMFSYFLMKEILSSKSGNLKAEFIHNAVQTEVRRASSELGYQYEQTPQIYGNRNLTLN